jgi:hypothetical protein
MLSALEHDPEKWVPVFGKDHAQTWSEVAMSRTLWPVLSALVLAMVGTSGASAQIGCQPTLTQPCAKPANKPNNPNNPPSPRTNASRSDDSNEPIDRSPRIKVDQDTDLKFGTGGIGLGRKF